VYSASWETHGASLAIWLSIFPSMFSVNYIKGSLLMTRTYLNKYFIHNSQFSILNLCD